MKQFLALCLALGLLSCGGSEAGTPASVAIISPLDGAEVPGPDVLVKLEASGVTITSADNHEPGTGHHHIFVDHDLTPLNDTIPAGISGIIHLGRGQTEFLVQGLAPGGHRLIAVIAEWTHVPLSPPAVDTVLFTVLEPSDAEAELEGEASAADSTP